jgi:hypothetical protein
MGLTQLISLAGYTTVICFFFYKLNEKTINEWRAEHKQQMNKIDSTISEWRMEHKQQLEKNEAHWREMFKYMNGRIDSSKKRRAPEKIS